MSNEGTSPSVPEDVPALATAGPVRRAGFAGLLALTMAISAFAIPSFSVLSRFLIEEFAISRSGLGWLITAAAFATALSAPLMGRVADAIGGRALTLALFGATAAIAALQAGAPTFAVLVLAAVLGGVPNAAGNPATNKLIATHVPTGQRGVVIGVKQSGVQIGIAGLGAVLPPVALVAGWRVAIGLVAVVSLVGLAAAALAVPTEPGATSDGVGDAGPFRHARAVRWIAAYAFLMGAGTSSLQSFIPLYAQETLGFTVTAAGLAISVMGGIGVVVRISLPRLIERRGRYVAPLAWLAVIAATASALVLIAGFTLAGLLWVGVALGGASVAAWNAVVMLAAVAIVRLQHVGRATGLIFLGFMAGFASAPVLFGRSVDVTGSYNIAWSAVVVLFLAAALLVWVAFRRGAFD